MAWNPETYLAFADQRTRPAAELLARVPSDRPRRVIDLGCGPGNSTALLAGRWPQAELEGLDGSAEMLAKARATGLAASWIEADIARWAPKAPYDVIFSNATLQWLPDQEMLLPRLMGFVKPGGIFAFQVPMNFNAPSHVLMREAAADPRWRAKLGSVSQPGSLEAARYYDILAPQAAALDIWQTEYLQVLEGEDAVYRWVSGTALRPLVQALDESAREDFIALYKAKLNGAYPRRPDGVTLFPFQRLFVVAVRA
jgi:trans-aconitate 2-methyltransferase